MNRRLLRIRRLSDLRQRFADGARLSLAQATAAEQTARNACVTALARMDAVSQVEGPAPTEIWMGRRALREKHAAELLAARELLTEAQGIRKQRQEEFIVVRREHEKLEKVRARMERLQREADERHRQAEDEELHRLVSLGKQAEESRRQERRERGT